MAQQPSGAGASASDIATLPMGGAGADAANESVSISGAQGRSQDFGGGSEEDLQNRASKNFASARKRQD